MLKNFGSISALFQDKKIISNTGQFSGPKIFDQNVAFDMGSISC